MAHPANGRTKRTMDNAGQRRGRGRPQLRPDEETREIIFDAARKEFAASGFAGSNMEAVARRAGISTKTLYRLIPNKAALFEAMITNRLDRFVSTVQLRASERGDIESALQGALLASAELVLNKDVIALTRMVLAESDNFPNIARTFYAKAMRRTVATLANWLKTENERALIAVEDPEIAAGILLGMLAFEPQRAAMFGLKRLPNRHELERLTRACAKLFLDGARVSSTRKARPAIKIADSQEKSR